MIQSVFEKIESLGMVDWAVLLHGVNGIPGHIDRLPPSYIERFAASQLRDIADSNSHLSAVSTLALDADLPASELRPLLATLCEMDGSNHSIALRIWRAASLEDVLQNVESDPVYGLLRLTAFWSDWGWPSDAPASMRTGATPLPEHRYHSSENLEEVVSEHRHWLKEELARLLSHKKVSPDDTPPA